MASTRSVKQRIVVLLLVSLVGVGLLGLSIYLGVSSARARNSVAEAEVAAGQAEIGVDSEYEPRRRMVVSPELSFDVMENLKVCERKAVRVTLDIGVGEYSERINEAMRNLSKVGGGTVVLDAGVYDLGAQLWIPPRICLRGRGIRKTTLRMQALSEPFEVAGMVRIDKATRVSLLDLTLDGAREVQRNTTTLERYGRYGVYATQFKYLWIRGVRAVNHGAYGFDPHGTRKLWSHYLVMQGCVAERNGLDGFTLDQTKHVSLLDSIAHRNSRHGVNIVTGSVDVLVRRVSASMNGADQVGAGAVGCGIIVQNNDKTLQTRDCVLDWNTVSESPRGGVCVSDAVNVTISNTNATITRFSDTPCYLLRNSTQVVLKNSRCITRSMRRVSQIDSSYTDDMPANVHVDNHLTPFSTGAYVADAFCLRGKRNKDICCPQSCGACGGKSCGIMRGLCCTSQIRATELSCDYYSAPCVMHPSNVPPPHVYIEAPIALAPGWPHQLALVPSPGALQISSEPTHEAMA